MTHSSKNQRHSQKGKNDSISTSAFGYENNEKYPICLPKKRCKEKQVGLSLIGEVRRHYIIIKGFKTFMYNQTFHSGEKHFCSYCLQAFGTEDVLKSYIKD